MYDGKAEHLMLLDLYHKKTTSSPSHTLVEDVVY